MKKITLRLLAYILIFAITACSSLPDLNLINDGDTVSVTSAVDTDNETSIDIQNQAIGDSAKVGATTGAVAGAAWGLVCGPFFILCSPAGALIYGTIGAGTGAVVGTALGLDAETEKLVNDRFSEYFQKQNPQEELLAKLTARAEARWQVIPSPADKEVIVQFGGLGLSTKDDGPVVFALQASITITYLDETGTNKTRTQNFEYEGSPTYIESWIEEDSGFMQRQLNTAYETITENIVISLSANP